MRIRVTNKSRHAGTVLVDDGDHKDDDRPMKLKHIGAGESIELAMRAGRGRAQAVGFEVLVEALPHNPKPENPSQTKAARK